MFVSNVLAISPTKTLRAILLSQLFSGRKVNKNIKSHLTMS
jgi:hypothetical protein